MSGYICIERDFLTISMRLECVSEHSALASPRHGPDQANRGRASEQRISSKITSMIVVMAHSRRQRVDDESLFSLGQSRVPIVLCTKHNSLTIFIYIYALYFYVCIFSIVPFASHTVAFYSLFNFIYYPCNIFFKITLRIYIYI